MMAIFPDMIIKTMEVFMDDFSVFENSFQTCLSHLEKMLKQCEDTNLYLNWDKSHFLVKEGIVLRHKISKNGIEVDKSKVNVIAQLTHPTTVKGDDKLLVIIAKDLSDEEKTALIMILKSHKRAIAWKLSDIKDQEKTTFTCPYGMFAYRRMPFGLCNAPGTFQRCMMAIFPDMIIKTMEVFMDDFSVFENSFQTCLSHLEKMLKQCEDTNLCLNWEKSHFLVKEGIVLKHKISKNGIEVDKSKVNVVAQLPHPTTVKGICSFLGHAGFYRRFIQDFLKIAWPMTHLLSLKHVLKPFKHSKEN
nr:reverse transcriptase domain-containing protein [Tanacetum cinerariifolium]